MAVESTTTSWGFDAAQTDALILDVTSTQLIEVLGVEAATANSNTVDVAVRLGFATTTLPTLTYNDLDGNPGVFFTRGGIARGGGAVRAIPALGPIGVPMRMTCSVPSGGDVRITITYRLLDTE